jgi:hypothetical protein
MQLAIFDRITASRHATHCIAGGPRPDHDRDADTIETVISARCLGMLDYKP